MVRNLNKTEALNLLKSNYIGYLSYIHKNKPFIAPMTYFFNKENNEIIGYSAEGHKVTAMRKNTNVCINVSEIDTVKTWKSVLAQGTFKELSGSEAKAKLHGFSLGIKKLIIEKKQRKTDFISDFSSKMYKDNLPVIFVVKIEEITGKTRKV